MIQWLLSFAVVKVFLGALFPALAFGLIKKYEL